MAVRPRPGQQRAFTLVELMVVMAILIILAAISLTAVEHIDTGNKKYTTKGLLMRVRQGLSAYQGDFDAYPDCAIHQNFNKHGKLGPVRHPDTDVDGNVIGVIIGNPGNNAGLNATQIRKPVPTDPEVNDDEGNHLSWTFYVANKHLVEQTSYVLKKQLVDADYTEYPSSYIGGGGPVDFDNDQYVARDEDNDTWDPRPGTYDGYNDDDDVGDDRDSDDPPDDPTDPGYNPTDEDPSKTSGRSSAERFRGGLKDAWGRPLVYLYWNGTRYVNDGEDEDEGGGNDNSVTSFSNTQRPVGMPGPIAGMEDTPEVWSGGPDKNWQDFRSPGGGGDPDNDNMSAMDVPDY